MTYDLIIIDTISGKEIERHSYKNKDNALKKFVFYSNIFSADVFLFECHDNTIEKIASKLVTERT